jgi:hypothetical protein
MEAHMSVEQTQDTMDRYFKALGGGDFAHFFTDGVSWTTIETGDEVRGPSAVRDAIVALHGQLSDMKTRRLVVSDGAAYIEGDCIGVDDAARRISYCVAYDVDGDRIAAMRAYGELAAMMPSVGPAIE